MNLGKIGIAFRMPHWHLTSRCFNADSVVGLFVVVTFIARACLVVTRWENADTRTKHETNI